MDHKRRESQRFNAGQKSFRRDVSKEPQGFARLDPAKMGLEGPDWLSSSSGLSERPTDSAVQPDPALSSPAPAQWPETGSLADKAPPARTLLEGMKVVCICKGIKKSVFWKVLDTGVRTKEEINHITGSGSGGCRGRRCGPCIMDMLRELLP